MPLSIFEMSSKQGHNLSSSSSAGGASTYSPDQIAGSGGVEPASSTVIQDRKISCTSRFAMYGARWDNVVCGLFGGATLAVQRGSETKFVHGQMKTLNASPQRLSSIQALLGMPIPRGLVMTPGMKTRSMDVLFE